MATTITGGHWTYSGNPSASNKDAVRHLLGDTDQTAQMLSDEEIEWHLADAGGVKPAAADAARALSARYVREPASKKVGDLSITYGDRVTQMDAIAARLEGDNDTIAGVSVGGISVADKKTETDDSDRTQPAFWRGMNDYPGTSELGSGVDSEYLST